MLLDLDDTILDDNSSVEWAWLRACETAAPELGIAAATLNATIERLRRSFWSDPNRHRVGRQDLDAAQLDLSGQPAIQGLLDGDLHGGAEGLGVGRE